MKYILLLTILVLSNSLQAENQAEDLSSIDGFIGRIEGLSVQVKRTKILYKFMLEHEQIKSGVDRTKKICDSMVKTVSAPDVNENDIYIWKCNREKLSQWLGDLTPYSDVKPMINYVKRPKYPDDAADEEGFVVVKFDIAISGAVENIEVVESSNSKFNIVSVESAKTLSYSPAYKYGEPIRVNGQLFRFQYSMR